MIRYDRPASLSAFEAISEAQKLAFSPIAFQAAVALQRLGVLEAIAAAGENGIDSAALASKLSLREYGIRVLLDMGLSLGLVWRRDERYVLDKVGYFWLNDRMTSVNANFVADVCYDAMSDLQDSVEDGAPRGLRRFGDWATLYPGLTLLPEPARTSWFSFDQFYSTRAFGAALKHVFESSPRRILDLGGNTGLWALACVEHDANVRVTIVDLPEQARVADATLQRSEHRERIDIVAIDLLDPKEELPRSDVIWMSQFLDCFSEAQIMHILELVVRTMDERTSLFILETLSDRQQHDAAAYSVNATSLYFTCIANGVSRMYPAEDLLGMIRAAGLRVIAQHDGLGVGHTLLQCVR